MCSQNTCVEIKTTRARASWPLYSCSLLPERSGASQEKLMCPAPKSSHFCASRRSYVSSSCNSLIQTTCSAMSNSSISSGGQVNPAPFSLSASSAHGHRSIHLCPRKTFGACLLGPGVKRIHGAQCRETGTAKRWSTMSGTDGSQKSWHSGKTPASVHPSISG